MVIKDPICKLYFHLDINSIMELDLMVLKYLLEIACKKTDDIAKKDYLKNLLVLCKGFFYYQIQINIKVSL